MRRAGGGGALKQNPKAKSKYNDKKKCVMNSTRVASKYARHSTSVLKNWVDLIVDLVFVVIVV